MGIIAQTEVKIKVLSRAEQPGSMCIKGYILISSVEQSEAEGSVLQSFILPKRGSPPGDPVFSFSFCAGRGQEQSQRHQDLRLRR